MTTYGTVVGDPAADPRGFRRCLGQFSTGVTIIAAEHRGRRVGVTANSFSSLSLEPPLILWSIARSSRSYSTFMEADRFAISILAENQIDVSQTFASKDEDKFSKVAWHRGDNGAPLITASAGHLECTTQERHNEGDHVLIVGRVTRFSHADCKALIFSQGRYSVGVDHPLLQPGPANAGVAPQTVEATTLGSLLFRAHLSSSRGFDEYRASMGLTLGASRVLYVLSGTEELPLDVLVREVDLPATVIEEDVADLAAHGDVERTAEGAVRVTPAGRQRYSTVQDRIRSYEQEVLKGIGGAEIDLLKRLLARIIEQSNSRRADIRRRTQDH